MYLIFIFYFYSLGNVLDIVSTITVLQFVVTINEKRATVINGMKCINYDLTSTNFLNDIKMSKMKTQILT